MSTATAFIDPGIYQRLDCGCIMYAVAIDPRGPRLCIVENKTRCDLPHSVDDFLPIRLAAAS